VLRERGPGLAKTCEPRVNRRQMLPIGVRVAWLRRCQAPLRKSQALAKKATCGTRVSGTIPAARSAPAWRAGSLDVLDRRAAKLRRFPSLWRSARRSHRPKPAFRKVIMDGDRRSDGRYLEISASSCPEGATLDWGWPPTYGSGPFALATPCTHVPGRYSGPSKFKSRVAHPWSWDIGSSTSAAWTSLNMVLSCRKARPFGLSTKLGLQESGRPSPKGTALWPEPCSMD